jgi:hypothetical protein
VCPVDLAQCPEDLKATAGKQICRSFRMIGSTAFAYVQGIGDTSNKARRHVMPTGSNVPKDLPR